ncbi:2'-5' RNA ligase [Mariprofundus micogutta]|uniref:RNA 2',3'-cyclic phosphodiesterase n=1 Tax=Mariprofundus micogutta TaxID=1921010 RepID=A0A1L8CNB4_9PROT|nr:RNA 2',3'-cyclic phosphodiesterase [Mariprofundus micogutta]GAV20410.1 2'-5' RNA ligase [Mariprofundus micogutta]
MRLFAALELPDHVVDELNQWWQSAQCFLKPSDWRPVSPHLWHLTLAFYGDVDGHDADDLAEALLQCAEKSPGMYLQSGGLGFFPRPARPRVFWAGVSEADEGKKLKRLAHCCRYAGHATVRKRTAGETAFRGHITVARSRGFPAAITPADFELIPEVSSISWCADRLSLFQSILQPDGPQYRRLETFELKGSAKGTRGLYV